MKCDRGKLIEGFNHESDESNDSDENDNNESDNSIHSSNATRGSMDTDTSDSDSEEETEQKDDNQQGATTSQRAAGGSEQLNDDDEEEEEDEVVKAIIRSRELHTNHPPSITTEDHVVDICFHPQNDIIAVASITGDVHIYKYDNRETQLVSTMELHLKACRDIAFNNNGTVLYSVAKDLSIMLTDLETEKLCRLYENAHEQPIYTVSVIGEHTFATGDDDGVVKFWDLRQSGNTAVFSAKKAEDYISSIITNSDAKYLVCASGDGSLTTFNIPEKKLYVQSEEYDEELTCLGLFKNERKLLSTTSKGKMYMFNWEEFGLHSDEFPSATKKAINCMVPITETTLITGGEDGLLRATSLFPHRQLGIVGQHDLSVESLDVNHDGTLIASSSHNNDIKFWNVSYFETLQVAERVKGGKRKLMKHNLPSSKNANAADFYADL